MIDTSHYLRINELKNAIYCLRIPYYTLCLQFDRTTGLSEAGILAEKDARLKMRRRKHALHQQLDGIRHEQLAVVSHEHQLVGRIDEVVETPSGYYIIDYKDSEQDYGYWNLQLCAYSLCLKEMTHQSVMATHVYQISEQQYHEIHLTQKHYKQLVKLIAQLHQMVNSEQCPPPATSVGKCRSCQYRRFCNDVC